MSILFTSQSKLIYVRIDVVAFCFLFISVLVYTSSLLEFAFSDDRILSHPGLLTKP